MCTHRFTQFARVAERDHIICPMCGTGDLDIDVSNIRVAFNKTVGRSRAPDNGVSMRFGFHPAEVEEARRELPGWKINDEGDVYVENGKHSARMMRELENMRSRETQRRTREEIVEGLDSTAPPNTVRKRPPRRMTRRTSRQGRTR